MKTKQENKQKPAVSKNGSVGSNQRHEISSLKLKSMEELIAIAEELKIESPGSLKKPALIFAILQEKSEHDGGMVFAEGVL